MARKHRNLSLKFFHQPTESDRLGDYLKNNLSSSWTHFRAAVAFVKRSGTRHIANHLADYARTGQVEIIAGIDHFGTSAEGLRDLFEAVNPNGRIIVFHNRLPFTFHPKVYMFKSQIAAEVLIGSGNLTEGGLFTNYEATLHLTLDLADPDQVAVLQSIECVLDEWADTSSGTAHILDINLLDRLILLEFLPSESVSSPETGEITKPSAPTVVERDVAEELGIEFHEFPFIARPVPRAPAFRKLPIVGEPVPPNITFPTTERESDSSLPTPRISNFVMTLQKTDVGVGQTTSGTSRRSPEIFIPLSARDAVPDFWNWPIGFTSDANRPGKRDRFGVRMRVGTDIINVNMMTWPLKHDFRLRSEVLRSAGNVGDILHLKKVDSAVGFEYDAEIIPQGTSEYSSYLALCDRSVRNSNKMYGYY